MSPLPKHTPARSRSLNLALCLAMLAACSDESEFTVEVEPYTLDPALDVRIESVSMGTGLWAAASGGVVVGSERGIWNLEHPVRGLVDVSCEGEG